MVTKHDKRNRASETAQTNPGNTDFMRSVRRHLAYRDDPILDQFIEPRRMLGFIQGMPHENGMAVIAKQLESLAGSNTPVIIAGPVGSGRFSVARALSDLTEQSGSPPVVLTCAGAERGTTARSGDTGRRADLEGA